jgi:PPP family 3-phenylpropionic acid transporter
MRKDSSLNRRIAATQGAFVSMQCVSTVFFVQVFQHFGYSNTFIGTIMMFAAVAMTIFQPVLGYLSDRAARDRLIIGGACILSSMLYFVLVFSEDHPIRVMICAVVIYTVFNPMGHLIDSYVSRLIAGGKRINYGATRAAGSLFYAITAAGFGFLVTLLGLRAAPFVSLFFCLSLCWFLKKLPNPGRPPEPNRKKNLPSGSLYRLGRNRAFILYVAAYFLTSFTTIPTNTYYSVVLYSLGGDDRHVGIGLFLSALCEVPVMLSFRRIREKTRLTAGTFIVIGTLFYALKTLCIGFAPNVPFVLIGSMLHGLSFAVFLPASIAFLIEIVDPASLASARMFSVTAGYSIVSILANPLGGAITDTLGVQNMLKIMSLPALLGVPVLIFAGKGLSGEKSA